MNPDDAAERARGARQQFPGFTADALAEVLVKRAARKTKWEGAASGLGVTGCEAVIAAPAPEPLHVGAATAGTVALLLGDMTYTTTVQLQLLLAIAERYECPFEPDDEDDVWTVFKAALGITGAERIGIYSRFVFAETARKQPRIVLRAGGVRKAVQDTVIKIAGRQVGRFLGEKYVMRLVPFANAGIGYVFNNSVTKKIGKWAKIKAKAPRKTISPITC